MKIVLFAPSDAYLFNFRGALAAALRAAGHEVLMVAPPGPFGAKFESLGYRWCPAPLERAGMNPFKELWFVFWLVRFLRRERVDLVHGFIIKGALYGSLAGRFAAVRARVGSITGLGFLFLNESWLSRLLRRLLRPLLRAAFSGKGVRVTAQNRDDLELLRARGMARPEILRLVPGSGVDCERFTPASRDLSEAVETGTAEDAQKSFRVLLPARLLWHKGIGDFIQALRILVEQGRKVQGLLAGDFDSNNPSSIRVEGVKDWVDEGVVEWLGYVDDMPALLRKVDAVVLPSYREGLPKALVEGAACGLPLITTDVPGCREVVTHGVEGLLVPARSPEELAEAIAQLQDAPQQRFSMGQAARRTATERFSEQIVLSRVFELYAELLSGFAGPRTVTQVEAS